MSIEITITVGIFLFSIFSGLVVSIRKMDMRRIENLESKMAKSQTEEEVRQLLNDKLEPVKTELQSINRSIEKLVDHLIEKK